MIHLGYLFFIPKEKLESSGITNKNKYSSNWYNLNKNKVIYENNEIKTKKIKKNICKNCNKIMYDVNWSDPLIYCTKDCETSYIISKEIESKE
tara:strand:- start:240 stop:518 length:279 start_codon:yes stop_codon:yes gene_type:complete